MLNSLFAMLEPLSAASAVAAGTGSPPMATRPGMDESMSTIHEVRVPDIGDFKDVPVIEILVKPGDAVAKDALGFDAVIRDR